MYDCDCCERRVVDKKSKGIGYLCDDCIGSWVYDDPYGTHSESDKPFNRGAGKTCPFKVSLKQGVS